MPHRGGYDRGWGYDRGFRYDQGFRGHPAPHGRGFHPGRPPARYDEGFRPAPYDRPYGPEGGMGVGFAPLPFPYVPFGYDPVMGPMAWPGAYPYAPGPDRPPRVPPRRSPAFGRGGDRALRAWADRYGYDVEFSIPPRRPRRP